MRKIALLLAFGGLAMASESAASEAEVNVGGYHDAALREAQNEWLGLSVRLAQGTSVGALPLNSSTAGPTALTSFTPRFSGLRSGAADRSSASAAQQGGSRAAPGQDRQVEFGLNDTSSIAGMSFDWSAKAGVSHQQPSQTGEPSSFVVGGQLAVSGVRFDAAYGERTTVLGVSGNRMTAGLGYGFGPIDARISYSVVSDAEDESAASVVTVGSRLTLQPGLVLQGDIAYAEEEQSGDAATAGVVGLQFNF